MRHAHFKQAEGDGHLTQDYQESTVLLDDIQVNECGDLSLRLPADYEHSVHSSRDQAKGQEYD